MPEQETSKHARREWTLALALAALALLGAGARHWREQARPGAGVVEAAAEAAFRLDVNTASQEELQALPGIGPGRSSAIVARREASGAFGSFEDFAQAAGVSADGLGDMRDLVTLGGE